MCVGVFVCDVRHTQVSVLEMGCLKGLWQLVALLKHTHTHTSRYPPCSKAAPESSGMEKITYISSLAQATHAGGAVTHTHTHTAARSLTGYVGDE